MSNLPGVALQTKAQKKESDVDMRDGVTHNTGEHNSTVNNRKQHHIA